MNRCPFYSWPDTKLQMLHRRQSVESGPFVVRKPSSSRLQLKPSINHRGISSTRCLTPRKGFLQRVTLCLDQDSQLSQCFTLREVPNRPGGEENYVYSYDLAQ